jgi:hypothetical protein
MFAEARELRVELSRPGRVCLRVPLFKSGTSSATFE